VIRQTPSQTRIGALNSTCSRVRSFPFLVLACTYVTTTAMLRINQHHKSGTFDAISPETHQLCATQVLASTFARTTYQECLAFKPKPFRMQPEGGLDYRHRTIYAVTALRNDVNFVVGTSFIYLHDSQAQFAGHLMCNANWSPGPFMQLHRLSPYCPNSLRIGPYSFAHSDWVFDQRYISP
jgi:hypothetical protein